MPYSEIYRLGWIYCFVLTGVTWFTIGLIPFLKWQWCYINDKKYVTPKFFKVFIEIDRNGDKFNWTVAWIFLSVIGCYAWPIALPAAIYTGLLNLVRFMFRTRKCLSKLNKAAHGHPNSIKTTPTEEMLMP